MTTVLEHPQSATGLCLRSSEDLGTGGIHSVDSVKGVCPFPWPDTIAFKECLDKTFSRPLLSLCRAMLYVTTFQFRGLACANPHRQLELTHSMGHWSSPQQTRKETCKEKRYQQRGPAGVTCGAGEQKFLPQLVRWAIHYVTISSV